MKRDELQKILREYMEEHGAMEFLWTVDDELLRPTFYRGGHEIICATGDFRGNFDYGRGLLVVRFSVYADWQNKDTYSVDMPIWNIDDGTWRAVSKNFDNREDAQKLCDKVFEDFKHKFGSKLPSEEDLNVFLRPFGMYGHSEG
jgi:hypothetical protein